MIPTHRATPDPALEARVLSRTPLRYAEGADPHLDRPAHVRAGSSLAWVPGGIAVVQDDANFLAVVDPADARARSLTLAVGPGGRRQFDDERGNKRHKLDLEACVALDDGGRALLVALGSGSLPRREHALLVDGWESGRPRPTLVHVPALYAALRDAADFAGGDLNLEGAVAVGDRVRLLGRGNGAARDGVAAANAICDLDRAALLGHLRDPARWPPPTPTDVARYDLGTLDGIALGFTDATAWAGTLLYVAAAEDSPDAVRDGRVAGSALGVLDARGDARWAPITDADGRRFVGKVEGVLEARGTTERLLVVVDADDPDAPSELCTVELRGPWRR